MTPYYQDDLVQLWHGNCLEVLPQLAKAGTIATCLTDPPYELGFMSKQWDKTGVSFQPATWQAVLEVLAPGAYLLAPGAYLLAFGGCRTWHRLACAIEDAGFEIRDTCMFLYATGFPKKYQYF